MSKNRKKVGIETKRQRKGYFFVAHWVLGLAIFFVTPLISSISYAFSDVTINSGSIDLKFKGLQHFKYILAENPEYVNNLTSAFSEVITLTPLIIALSLVLAIILNQKFVGRTVARAVFFLPVIIASSVVLELLSGPKIGADLFTISSGAEYNYGGLINFREILSGFNLPTQISGLLIDYLGKVFGIIWSCGIPTILFLSGLQSIPLSLYEVSKIEGASKWDEFWRITIPMLRNIIVLVLIYTIIDKVTSVDNPVMQQSYVLLRDKQIYDQSSAMLWLYFSLVLVAMGIVLVAYNRLCIKKWE